MDSNEVELIENDQVNAMFRGYIYAHQRTNKDKTRYWRCPIPKCKGTLTTNINRYVLKVNGIQKNKHITKKMIADAHSHPTSSKKVESDSDKENVLIDQETKVNEPIAVANKATEQANESDESDVSIMDTTDQDSSSVIEKDDHGTQFEDAYKNFKIHIKNVKSSGAFCSGGEAENLPVDIGFSANDFGAVKFPLKKTQAENLIQKCTQAPFGLKEKTLYDKTVRDTLQLDPSSFKINNSKWHEGIKELVRKVQFELGCSCEIEAVPYKFLLYKTGGHLKKQRVTEKEKSILIVQLPSTYTGGQLNVYKKNEIHSYNFGSKDGKSSKSIHYAAHYADLENVVEPITSGKSFFITGSL